jgi:hypothetical protein
LAGLSFQQDVEVLEILTAKGGGFSVESLRKSGPCHHKRRARKRLREIEKILPILGKALEGSHRDKKYGLRAVFLEHVKGSCAWQSGKVPGSPTCLPLASKPASPTHTFSRNSAIGS